jgi:hydrogenase expression/formation protein HypE
MRLPLGKIPPKILKGTVFNHLGAEREEVVVGPSLGLDGAIVKVGETCFVSSMDPITGVSERIGWEAININANDVATFGVEPRFFSSCLLLPENSTEKAVEIICRQIDLGAKDLNIAVIGGHSETTPNLRFPIVIGCCMGVTSEGNYVTAQGAKPGNQIILTKSVGLEGSAILASENGNLLIEELGLQGLKKARNFSNHISIVKEALVAFKTGNVTAMHDPTEGGFAGGLHELADASDVGFRIYEDKISIAEETIKICKVFHIDPLQLIASGSLLITVEKSHSDEVIEVLNRSHIKAAVIGEILSSHECRHIADHEGNEEKLVRPLSDHLWQALKSKKSD